MENKIKENALNDFIEMIKISWTYKKLTQEEINRLTLTWECVKNQKMIIGSYEQRWKILLGIYHTFLIGVGYTGFDWRE